MKKSHSSGNYHKINLVAGNRCLYIAETMKQILDRSECLDIYLFWVDRLIRSMKASRFVVFVIRKAGSIIGQIFC